MLFTLIGMPGSGKSCMGRAVSGKVKLKNIDSDVLIQKKEGKKLYELIAELGTDGFKALEEKTLTEFSEDNCILSTGGSAVYYDSAMRHLKELGKVIYLKVDLNTIKERIGDYSKRGIVLKPGQTIDDLYSERCALYEKYADFTINCSGKAFPRYHAQLIEYINSFK